MAHHDPTKVMWWLVSRASGIVALVLICMSVLIGLAMATKVLRGPSLKRACVRLHEHLALIALAAIALHGVALLGDSWLKPGVRGIAVPFALSYRSGFTGLGIIAGYLAALLGPSFYFRRRIGTRRWRQLHRATVLVWVLATIHTLGAGSDRTSLWLRAIVVITGVPIVYLLTLRALQPSKRSDHPPRRPVDARIAEIQHLGRTHAGSSATHNERRSSSVYALEDPQPDIA